jgi:hypothetical protein
VKDVETGFNLVRTRILNELNRSDRSDFEPEFTAKLEGIRSPENVSST